MYSNRIVRNCDRESCSRREPSPRYYRQLHRHPRPRRLRRFDAGSTLDCRHIGIGRTHARTHVILLVDDLHVRVIDATTGELLRDLTIDTTRDYQPTGKPNGPTPPKKKRPKPS